MSHSTKELVKKAQKALFGLKAYTKSLNNLPVKVACHLFDSLIKPIMIYNSEVTYLDTYISLFRAKNRALNSGKEVDILSFAEKSPIEKLHLHFCKFLLGTRKNASNLATRAELGRLPIEFNIKTQTLLYLKRFECCKLNPLLKEAYTLSKNLDSEGVYSWFTYVKNILSELNLDIAQIQQNTSSDKKINNSFKVYIKTSSKNYFENLIHDKMQNIDEKSKLYLYKNLKQNLRFEDYLRTSNFTYRKLITKLRISDHNLNIEKGRHTNIPREQRLCLKCKTLENEKHFILDCKLNMELRNNFFNNLDFNFSVKDLSDEEKLIFILNPSTPSQVNKLGSYIKRSLELRTGDTGIFTVNE